ncbi:MAG: hypothetical protein RLZZ436_2662 [Planctomycetota bacterium]
MTSPSLRKPLITLLSSPSHRPGWNPAVGRICCSLLGAIACLISVEAVIAGDQPREKTVSEAWQSHLDDMLDGLHDFASFETAGEFWARQHDQQSRNAGASSDLRSTFPDRRPLRKFISNHTWEQPSEPSEDVFDSSPVAVLAPEVAPAVHSQESADEQSESSRRLKTDIRTIKPSLSYALRDIDATQLPSDYDNRLDKGEYVARKMSPAVLQWAPTNFYHYPLYFEDPALERYGHAWHPVVQPFVSTGRFAGQLVGLPYQMVINPVHSRQYALGYYRPGEPAPKKHYQIPWNNEAVVMQTAAIVGLFLIIP